MQNRSALRISAAAIGAGFLTLALFYLMVMLISQTSTIPVTTEGSFITIVKPLAMKPVIPLVIKPIQVIPPETPPLPPVIDKLKVTLTPGTGQTLSPPAKKPGTGIEFGLIDVGFLPLVSVQPNYPRRAARQGIEGYTIVEFEVTAQGLVQNPRVIEHHPNSVFDNESLKAIRKFKYKPEVIKGVAIPRQGVMNRFTFELKQS